MQEGRGPWRTTPSPALGSRLRPAWQTRQRSLLQPAPSRYLLGTLCCLELVLPFPEEAHCIHILSSAWDTRLCLEMLACARAHASCVMQKAPARPLRLSCVPCTTAALLLLQALQSRFTSQSQRLGVFGTLLGDKAAEVTAMAQQSFSDIALPSAFASALASGPDKNSASGLLSSFKGSFQGASSGH